MQPRGLGAWLCLLLLQDDPRRPLSSGTSLNVCLCVNPSHFPQRQTSEPLPVAREGRRTSHLGAPRGAPPSACRRPRCGSRAPRWGARLGHVLSVVLLSGPVGRACYSHFSAEKTEVQGSSFLERQGHVSLQAGRLAGVCSADGGDEGETRPNASLSAHGGLSSAVRGAVTRRGLASRIA